MAAARDNTGGEGQPTRRLPQRMCVACRQSGAKRELIRIVRDGLGRVSVDPTGRRNGRGAYLCHDRHCWELALRRHALERALHIETLHPDDYRALLAFTADPGFPIAEEKS